MLAVQVCAALARRVNTATGKTKDGAGRQGSVGPARWFASEISARWPRGWAEKAVVIGISIADGASNQPLKHVIPQLSEESLISLADFYRGIRLER